MASFQKKEFNNMVVAGKIFKLTEQLPLADVAAKLDGYRTEENFEEGDYNFTLVTEVAGLLPKENTLTGVYSHDYVMHVFHRGKTAPLPRTVEALFSFAEVFSSTVLTEWWRPRFRLRRCGIFT